MNNCPPYQDAATLADNLCISASTVDNWVVKGILPPPKVVRGGKRLWKWSEVEQHLDGGPAEVRKLEDLRDAARRATSGGH